MYYSLKNHSWLILFLLTTFPMIACKKECTPPTVKENIIGTWTAVHQVGNRTLGPETVTFNSDGTLEDNDFIIFNSSGISLAEKRWVLDNLNMEVQSGGTTGVLRLVENRCNFISFEVDRFGTFLELSR